MRRPPRPLQESLFTRGMWQHMLWVGLLMGGLCLLTQTWALHSGSAHWQTRVFTVLTLSQMGHVLAIRTEKESLFSIGVFFNQPLIFAVLLTFMLQMATIYVLLAQPDFQNTTPEHGRTCALPRFIQRGVLCRGNREIAGTAEIDLSHELSVITRELQSAQGMLEKQPAISRIFRRHTEIHTRMQARWPRFHLK